MGEGCCVWEVYTLMSNVLGLLLGACMYIARYAKQSFFFFLHPSEV